MTLNLREELEEATSAMAPPSDLVSRARSIGQHRLVVRRRCIALGGAAVLALLGVGLANIPMKGAQTIGPVQTGSVTPTPETSATIDRAQRATTNAVTAAAAAARRAEAEQRCQKALTRQPQGTRLLFVSATTVATVRTHTGAPVSPALGGEPWASLNPDETAAWCTLQTGSNYKIIAATVGGANITFVTSKEPLGDPGPNGPSIP